MPCDRDGELFRELEELERSEDKLDLGTGLLVLWMCWKRILQCTMTDEGATEYDTQFNHPFDRLPGQEETASSRRNHERTALRHTVFVLRLKSPLSGGGSDGGQAGWDNGGYCVSGRKRN